MIWMALQLFAVSATTVAVYKMGMDDRFEGVVVMRIGRREERLNDLRHTEVELVSLVVHCLQYDYGLDDFDTDFLVKLIKAKFARERQLVEQTNIWKLQ